MNLIEKDDLDRDASEYTHEVDIHVLTLPKLFAGNIGITVRELHVLYCAYVFTKNIVPLALLTGFVFPTCMGWLWGDTLGAFIWGGLVVRIAVWHCTFCVNS